MPSVGCLSKLNKFANNVSLNVVLTIFGFSILLFGIICRHPQIFELDVGFVNSWDQRFYEEEYNRSVTFWLCNLSAPYKRNVNYNLLSPIKFKKIVKLDHVSFHEDEVRFRKNIVMERLSNDFLNVNLTSVDVVEALDAYDLTRNSKPIEKFPIPVRTRSLKDWLYNATFCKTCWINYTNAHPLGYYLNPDYNTYGIEGTWVYSRNGSLLQWTSKGQFGQEIRRDFTAHNSRFVYIPELCLTYSANSAKINRTNLEHCGPHLDITVDPMVRGLHEFSYFNIVPGTWLDRRMSIVALVSAKVYYRKIETNYPLMVVKEEAVLNEVFEDKLIHNRKFSNLSRYSEYLFIAAAVVFTLAAISWLFKLWNFSKNKNDATE